MPSLDRELTAREIQYIIDSQIAIFEETGISYTDYCEGKYTEEQEIEICNTPVMYDTDEDQFLIGDVLNLIGLMQGSLPSDDEEIDDYHGLYRTHKNIDGSYTEEKLS